MALTIIEKPDPIELFDINPRTVVVESDLADAVVKLELEIYNLQSAQYELVSTIYANRESNRYSWNISKFFVFGYSMPTDAQLQLETPSVPVIADEVFGEYKVTIREYDPTDLQTETDSVNFEAQAIRGGVSKEKERYFDFSTELSTERLLLTKQPRTKLVTKEQPEWVAFRKPVDTADLYIGLEVLVTFDNGSFVSYTPGAATAVTKQQVYYLACGFNQIDIAYAENAFGLTAVKYRVRVVFFSGIQPKGLTINTTVARSEWMTYEIDFDQQDWPVRYYLFQNSYGGIDTLATRGKATVRDRAQRSTVAVSSKYNDAYHQHSERIDYAASGLEVKVNIGFLEYESRMWLQELNKTKYLWEIDLVNNRFIPILLSSTNINLHEDDNSLQDAEFSYITAKSEAL